MFKGNLGGFKHVLRSHRRFRGVSRDFMVPWRCLKESQVGSWALQTVSRAFQEFPGGLRGCSGVSGGIMGISGEFEEI